MLLIAAFDVLGPNLAFNDDWGMAWAVDHFPRIYPASSALAYPQDLWAWLVTFGDHDRRLLRLSTIAFVVAALAGVERLARRAGASPTWAAMAALSLAAFPVFSADATTFMTDVPYVAVEVLAVLAALRWQEGRSPLPFLALCVAAVLQRQVGVMVPLAVVAALVVLRRRDARQLGWPALAAAAAGLALVAISVAGLAPPTTQNRIGAVSILDLFFAVTGFMFLPGVAGLGAAVLLPGLVAARGTARLAPLALGLLVWEGFVFAVAGHDVLPGNVFTPRSLNWTFLAGHKPQVYPTVLFAVLEVLAVAAVMAVLLRLPRAFESSRPVATILAAVAVSQFLPVLLVHYLPFDRYFLPVVAVLLPLAAAAASDAGERAAYAGMAVAGLLLGVYAVGEQDFQAWQEARDRAAHLAYAQASPYQVNAGYEANAVYGEVPAYDRNGTILSGLARPGARDFSLDGPAHPLLRLLVVPASDPRPGFTYWSLAPGKVIVVPGDVQS